MERCEYYLCQDKATHRVTARILAMSIDMHVCVEHGLEISKNVRRQGADPKMDKLNGRSTT